MIFKQIKSKQLQKVPCFFVISQQEWLVFLFKFCHEKVLNKNNFIFSWNEKGQEWLTLFHFTPRANLFYIGRGGLVSNPPLTSLFLKIDTWNLVTLFIFKFRIKVMSTMTDFWWDNQLFVELITTMLRLQYRFHKSVSKTLRNSMFRQRIRYNAINNSKSCKIKTRIKRYLIIDQQIVRHFFAIRCLSNPPSLPSNFILS